MAQRLLPGRAGKIVSRFPAFMRADDAAKTLGRVALALGRDLDEAERNMMRVQRAHRLGVADEARDVLQLGALLGLHPSDFYILGKLHEHRYFVNDGIADPQTREQAAYDLYVNELRDTVGRMIEMLFDGCGTIWALLEGTAILIDADRPGDQRTIEHLDLTLPKGGFVHRIAARYHIVKDGEPAETDGFIYLVENPIVDKQTELSDRHQRELFPVKRGGFFEDRASVEITGTGNRTVLPVVQNIATHEGVGYTEPLADGSKLVFAADGTVTLDGQDASAKVYSFRGALAGGPGLPPGSPYDGQPWRDVTTQRPENVFNPWLPLGESTWRFMVQEGAYDATRFDRSVFAFPRDAAARAALPPSGKVQVKWQENVPFAATVLIPADLTSLQDANIVDQDIPTLVRAGLERFRSAGISLDVRYFDEQWLLDSSVLEEIPT